MKKYILDFMRRGLVASGFGPLVLAIFYLILHHNGYRLNGSDLMTSSTDVWCEYTIPLDYKTLDQRPTHIIISCAASQFGDYFTGCSSSKLWIDKVELVY